MDFGLQDETLVVTGGGSGIGRAICEEAGRQGMRVAVLDAHLASATEVADRLVDDGGKAIAVEVDVRDAGAVARAMEVVDQELGPVYGAVTSAGISRPAPPETMTSQDWSDVIDINLTGTFNTAQAAGVHMLRHGRGSIVLVGSTNTLGGHSTRANYTATKHAVHGLGRSLAIDWGRRGVRVNTLAPGTVDTPLLRNNNSQEWLEENFIQKIPQGRLCTPQEQALACMFLLSEAASYVTGTVLAVDGGLTAGYFTQIPR